MSVSENKALISRYLDALSGQGKAGCGGRSVRL